MSDDAMDPALVAAMFALVAQDGWRASSVPAAARLASLDLAAVRPRFADKHAVLLRFGAMADSAAVTGLDVTAPPQERLFDMLMRRIDVLQAHRAGVLALLRGLPADPATALMLGAASLASMSWLIQAADLPAQGAFGFLRGPGLLAVWLWTLRSWRQDDSPDLSATMATLDAALARAAQAARSLPGQAAMDAAVLAADPLGAGPVA